VGSAYKTLVQYVLVAERTFYLPIPFFQNAISRSDRLVRSASRQTAEQSREARLVRIAHGILAIGVDPFRMLDPQIVVNLLLEFSVGVDLVTHGNWLGDGIQGCRGTVATTDSAESTSLGVASARHGQVRALQKAVRMCWRWARRQANSMTASRWRCSKTASSPLCVSVRVGVDFVITWSFLFLSSED
jgi:hypothetical protein